MHKLPEWQLHDAKARFSELFRRALTNGPQLVVKQHGEAVVIMSAEDFERAVEKGRHPDTLLEFFQSAPTGAQALDLKRKRDKTRKIKW